MVHSLLLGLVLEKQKIAEKRVGEGSTGNEVYMRSTPPITTTPSSNSTRYQTNGDGDGDGRKIY